VQIDLSIGGYHSMDNSSDDILGDFVSEADFAKAHKLSPRTVAKYRAEGLPWMSFGGRVLIGPQDEVRAWVLKRVRRTSGGTR
jgi:hypothetical protein